MYNNHYYVIMAPLLSLIAMFSSLFLFSSFYKISLQIQPPPTPHPGAFPPSCPPDFNALRQLLHDCDQIVSTHSSLSFSFFSSFFCNLFFLISWETLGGTYEDKYVTHITWYRDSIKSINQNTNDAFACSSPYFLLAVRMSEESAVPDHLPGGTPPTYP